MQRAINDLIVNIEFEFNERNHRRYPGICTGDTNNISAADLSYPITSEDDLKRQLLKEHGEKQ